MKKLFLFIISLLMMSGSFSQSVSSEDIPKGMFFVPQGNFIMKTQDGDKIVNKSISVEAFYMTNEITNKEYREFVEWSRNNQDISLKQVKSSNVAVYDPKTGSIKDTMLFNI